MAYRICFPNGLKRAFTLSYDDGQIYDRKLVQLFNKYGLKATFHLNFGKLNEDSEADTFLSAEEIKDLFTGHEIACHGVSHPYFGQLTDSVILREILDDREQLEKYGHCIVRGMSYPYGEYSDRIINIARVAGVEYSRTVEDTMSFNIPDDFMKWKPTCHHNKALSLVEDFLNGPHFRDMAIFYVWGHSFEFDRENTWDMMEEFCKQIGGHEHVWYATNIEIKDYITAARALIFSADNTVVYNPSAIDVYLYNDDKLVKVKSGATLTLK